MSKTIVIIIDKNEAYVNFQKTEVLDSWKISSAETQNITNFNEAGATSLFGDSPVSLLNIDNVDDLKKLITSIEKASTSTIEGIAETGLIITCSVPRTQTKKLEALAKKINADLKVSQKDKPVSTSLLNELNINRDTKAFLLDYVGDDYTALFAIVEALRTVPKELQVKISVDDMLMRLPQPPGSVPPWEIERPLLNNDLNKVIDISRRVPNLVLLAVLKNKFQLMYRCGALLKTNPKITNAQIAKTLNVPDNYPLKLARTSAQRYEYDTIEKAVKVLFDTEKKLKGGSTVNSQSVTEIALTQLVSLMAGR